jgi:2-aminoadipate transaminase
VEIAQRWSREHPLYLIEDAAYRELRYEGEDIPSLRAFDPTGETVIVAGTFSKSFSPGLRVGWGILPKRLVGPICEQKGNLDFGSPNLAQHLMHQVIEQGLYEPHIDTLRTAYREKQQAMLQAAEKYFSSLPDVRWHRPQGGLYVWLTLPESIDTGPAGTLFDRAIQHGMLYVAGQFCYPSEGPRQSNTIRLSFGVQTAPQIRRGMKMLAEAIREELAE